MHEALFDLHACRRGCSLRFHNADVRDAHEAAHPAAPPPIWRRAA